MNKVKLGDIGKIVTGKTPLTKNPAFFDNDFMFITPEDITTNPSNLIESRRYISKLGLNSISTNSIDGESVVVGCIGSDMGNIGYVKGKCATNQQLNSITDIKKEYNAKFIYYCLKPQKEYLRKIAGSTTTPILPKSVFEDIEINLPNLQTQSAIAKVLSSLDNKIELNNKINKELENLARTIYEYWFVQNAEESWERKKIGDLGELKNGANYEKANLVGKKVKIVNVRNISSSSIYIGVENLDEIILPKNEIDKYLLDENDILFARSGIPGAVRLIEKTSENVIFCGFTIRFRLNDKSLKNYLFFPLKRNEEFAKNKSGGSIMPNISQDVLKDIFVSIPPTELLEKFNKTVSPIFSQIIKNRQENAELAQQRDFLLPLLMNGQVKIKIV